MSRQTDFPYALQHVVETAESARANREEDPIAFDKRQYEKTYLQSVTWSGAGAQVQLSGTYGTIAYVYEHPWEMQDITYIYDGPVIHEGSIAGGN